jgi:hypothetical protein
LKESGKVSKARNKQPKQKKVVKKSSVKTADHVVEAVGNDPLPRPGTANTLDSKVEEIFQVRSVEVVSTWNECNPTNESLLMRGTAYSLIDNLHVRLIFDLGKKQLNSRKELIKISKIAKFDYEML